MVGQMLNTPWRLFPRPSLPPPPNPPSSAPLSCSTGRDVVLVVGAAILGGAVVAIGAPLLSSHTPHFPYASQPRGWLQEIFDRVVAFWGDRSRNSARPGKFFTEAVPKSGDSAVDAGLSIEILKEMILGDSVDTQELNCFKSIAAENLDHYNPCKRQGYLSWEDYFMAIAFLSAQRSKDPNRQVGACLVSQDNVILGIGYNGFPRGCSDDELPWAKKSVDGDPLKTKYPYVCHAEVNAILNKNHASACGQKLFVTMFPCNECAKIIIQAGIAEVVYYTEKLKTRVASDFSYAASRKLLLMAKVKVSQHVFAK